IWVTESSVEPLSTTIQSSSTYVHPLRTSRHLRVSCDPFQLRMTQVTLGFGASGAAGAASHFVFDSSTIVSCCCAMVPCLAMSDSSISVAMCTFNGERFLQAQLESIATQSVLPDELIVCDDGSSDNSREIIEQFASRATFHTCFVTNPVN